MSRINVLMIGTGEYTTGFVHRGPTQSDKGPGVVALSIFDLRRRGMVDRVLMAGRGGSKFPRLRRHLQSKIGDVYKDISVDFHSYPDDSVNQDAGAYEPALKTLSQGDVVTVFTPDDTHFEIAMQAIQQGCHVLIAKPIVKTLQQHLQLQTAAQRRGVLVAMEVHKRWDPIYRDARDRIRQLGEFSFFQSYMSQPKSQLDTFRSWAGKSSDISYYLNAHHIDFHVWSIAQSARPIQVHAAAASGVAQSKGIETEDTITLTVTWENVASGNLGTGVYTSSWIAPKSDVHSQQSFFYMGHDGEIRVDQAHRGYSISTDTTGFVSANPLFMKYEPNELGMFIGQHAYGYRSIADFVEAAIAIRAGALHVDDFHHTLAMVDDTVYVTAILEAGRRSLDENRVIALRYDDNQVVGFG